MCSSDLDRSALEYVEPIGREVFANDADQADRREERCRQGEINGRAAEDFVGLAVGGLDGVNADAAGDE